MLRTRFVSAQLDQQPELELEQHVEQAQAQVCQVIDAPFQFNLQAEAVADEASAQAIALEEAAGDFDLSQDALIRARLLQLNSDPQLNSDDHVLLVTMHHSVSDGWSLGVFFRELTAFYDGFTDNQQAELAPLAIQYADYAKWQRDWLSGETLKQQLHYWCEQLSDMAVESPLPTDRPRPAVKTYRGGVIKGNLPAELVAQLDALSQAHNATLYMTLLAAFNVLLARYSRQTDIVVGSPVANRNRAELEPLIGFFVNTLVMRNNLAGDPLFTDLLQQVKQTALNGFAHQDIPFDFLVEQLQPERNMSMSPLFQVMFVLQNMPLQNISVEDTASHIEGANKENGLSVSGFDYPQTTAKFDLTVNLFQAQKQQGGSIACELEYNTDLFDSSTIERIFSHFQQVLQQIALQHAQPISAYELMQTQEYAQQLAWSVGEGACSSAESNQSKAPKKQQTAIGLFEQQAAKATPMRLR